MQTLKDIFESLVNEADYNKFDNKDSEKMTAIMTNDRQTNTYGDGEEKGIDAGRVSHRVDNEAVYALGLDKGARVNNIVERDFIIAQVYQGLRDRGNRSIRLTYPSMDIIGAVAVNPTVSNEHGESVKKFQVVNTAEGSTEEALPVYYTINTKVKAESRSLRRDEHNSRNDNQQFANELYDHPEDYTTAFSDARIVQKTRGNSGTAYAQDAGSVGSGLVPQKSASGIAISEKSGTNTVSKHTFVATRCLKVDDVKRFITRKGAANGIIGHFVMEVQGGERMSLISFMGKYGEALRDGRFHKIITALANEDVVTNRIDVNPGVDNDYFYIQSNIPVPGTQPAPGDEPNDWNGFLSEIAKSASGFDSADAILSGLDDETVYALYAYCAIPVKLSRIFFARLAVGEERNLGLVLSHNNIQNKTSTELAKITMNVLENGVDVGESYELPGGIRMFVISKDEHDVTFPAEWFNNNQFEKLDSDWEMTMHVQVVTGVMKKGDRDIFFRLPYCTSDDGRKFIFMRYGGNDIGPQGDESCSSPDSMSAGYMLTAKKPILDINFVSPEMNEKYQEFYVGVTTNQDMKDMAVPADGPRVDMSVASYVRDKLRGTKKDVSDNTTTKAEEPKLSDEISDVTGDLSGMEAMSDKDFDKVASKAALQDAKDNDEWVDFSQPRAIWQKQIDDIDAKNGQKKGPQMTDGDIDDLMREIEAKNKEDDRTDRDYEMANVGNDENDYDTNDQED